LHSRAHSNTLPPQRANRLMFSGDRFIVNAVIDSGDAHSDSPRGAAASSSSSQRPPVPPPPLANGVGQVTGAALETRLIAYCEQNGAAFDAFAQSSARALAQCYHTPVQNSPLCVLLSSSGLPVSELVTGRTRLTLNSACLAYLDGRVSAPDEPPLRAASSALPHLPVQSVSATRTAETSTATSASSSSSSDPARPVPRPVLDAAEQWRVAQLQRYLGATFHLHLAPTPVAALAMDSGGAGTCVVDMIDGWMDHHQPYPHPNNQPMIAMPRFNVLPHTQNKSYVFGVGVSAT
jgi:hypothetical protein